MRLLFFLDRDVAIFFLIACEILSQFSPRWDGKIELQLLGTSSSGILSASSSSNAIGNVGAGREALMAKSNVTNYAFLNKGARVKVYVELPGVGDCKDKDVLLDFTKQSLCMMVKNYLAPSTKGGGSGKLVVDTAAPDAEEKGGKVAQRGEDCCLSFGKLYVEIKRATFQKKADRVIITLTKKEEIAWSKVIA